MNIYNRISEKDGIVILVKDNQLIAISEVTQDGLKPKKVMI